MKIARLVCFAHAFALCLGFSVTLVGCGDVGTDETTNAAPTSNATSNATSNGTANDVGQVCDPLADTTDCALDCLELPDGTGVCIDVCGNSGSINCPDGYICKEGWYDEETEQNIELCLPDVDCGDATEEGVCDGATLKYCDFGGPTEVDCAGEEGENGEPMGCAEVFPNYFDCVSSDYTGGCAEETFEGRCDGNTVVFCQSFETGETVREDCSDGQECGMDGEGFAICRVPGSAGCGQITALGQCEGNTIVWCDMDTTEVMRSDCNEDGQTCGWIDDANGFNCVAAPSSEGTNTVTGTFMYEKPELSEQGLSDTVEAVPVRKALVQVLNADDNSVLGSSFVGDQGEYSIGFEPPGGDVYVRVLTSAENDRYSLSVRDCPMEDCNGVGNLHAVGSPPFTPSANYDVGQIVIPRSGQGGAFNIFEMTIRGLDFAWDNLGGKAPNLIIHWKKGSGTAGGTSYYDGRSSLFILGTEEDTDEYDDPVLGHEIGHFLESKFSRSDSPGGDHDGSPTDPRLAWGEGYGTYVGCLIFGSSRYIDSSPGSGSVTDIANIGSEFYADPNHRQRLNQPISEFLTAEILWKIGESQGNDKVFDVLGNYFPSNSFDSTDRGVAGVELVDFLDGWFCRGHGAEDVIREIVNTTRRFPYDYNGTSDCQ